MLNNKQEEVIILVSKGKNIFVSGMAGTGKTTIIKKIIEMYGSTFCIGKTSTTGTSALLLKGSTLHSYLGVGLGNGSIDNIIKRIKKNRLKYDRWLLLDLLIIDEISMMEPNLLEKLENIARIIRNNNKIFGGIQLLFSGDFCQLPPVGCEKLCLTSKIWNKCIDDVVVLDIIMRQNDKYFQNVLNKVRIGNIDSDVRECLDSRVGVKLTNEYGIEPTKLYCVNKDVDSINEKMLNKLSAQGAEFYEYDMEFTKYRKEADIEKFLKYCSPKEKLQLCIGAQVILLKNLDLPQGLANGSRGVVTDFVDDLPLVKFLNGYETVIDYAVWEVEENDIHMFDAHQIPLKIGYALTIHRSQGCSLDLVQIDLSKIFEYGQAYVALSRVKYLQGLSIISIDYNNILAHPDAVKYYEKITTK